MSQFACPLCGKFVSLRLFEPSGFDRDIYAVEVRGLGRGRGVKVVGRHSILKPGNKTATLIGERCLVLIGILMESGCLKPDKVAESVGVEEEIMSAIHETVADVDEVLGDEYEFEIDEANDLVEALKERARILIGEYEVLESEEEQRGRRKKVRH